MSSGHFEQVELHQPRRNRSGAVDGTHTSCTVA